MPARNPYPTAAAFMPSPVLRADDRDEMFAGLVDALRVVAHFASRR